MYKDKSIMAVITARGGSKGVPRKNIRDLSGKPLIAWTIEAAKNSGYIDRIIVSTEDTEIRDISLKYGAEVPFLRPKELAEDNSSSVDTVLHVIEKLEKDYNYTPDYILLLQPTSPLRNEVHIDDSIEALLEKGSEFDSLISVTELERPVYWNRMIGVCGELKKFLEYDKGSHYRRQDFQKVFRHNGAIYLIETKAFKEMKSFETENTFAYVMDRVSSVDIDTEDDFRLAEYYLGRSF